MADPADAASTKSPHHRRRETRAASGVPSAAQGAGCRVGGGASSEAAPGERARLALDAAESAARLLEDAFVSMVEENELSMPALGRLHAALQEAEAAVGVLEARLPRGHRHGDPESGSRDTGGGSRDGQ